MAEINSEVERLLKSINNSIERLDDNETTYKRLKAEYTEKIQTDLDTLALLSEGHETLSDIVSYLYWNTNIPAKQIYNINSSDPKEVRNLVRYFELEFPCSGNCGTIIKEGFSSRSSLADFKRNHRDHYRKCYECSEKNELKYKQQSADNQKRHQEETALYNERNKKLSEMSWANFIETPEWTYIRNSHFCDVGGKCEVCGTKSETLYLYPHKDTPQCERHYKRDAEYRYFVLCNDCIKRYKGLIVSNRRDVIKTEVFPIIWKWARETEYGLWD